MKFNFKNFSSRRKKLYILSFKEFTTKNKMSYQCKIPFCNSTTPENFYEYNRSVCKNCLSQRRKLAKDTAEANAVKVVKTTKTKTRKTYDTKNSTTLMNIITNQQKMLENQQRQTDALLGLTEKLFERVTSRSSDTASPKVSTPVFRPAISHTPRKRQHLVHYKDRLNNDI